jgi:glycosyltransferase involved in cell wall biosynthesis
LLVDQTIEFAVYQHYVETLPKKFRLLKPLLGVDVIKLKFWERRFWKQADCLVAVSSEDKTLMKNLSNRQVEIVPNGVDEELLKEEKFKKYVQPTVLYGVANFKWMQNKEGAINLLKHVWPKITKQMPQARLFIAGRHSEPFIQTTGLVKNNQKNILVREVENPKEVYSRSWVMVAPMRSGGGSRTKFFEAMACGLPIVTTPEGIEGIDAKKGEQVVLANSFSKLAEQTVHLLKNKNLRNKIGRGGRELVKEKYSWRESADKLLTIYQKVSHYG